MGFSNRTVLNWVHGDTPISLMSCDRLAVFAAVHPNEVRLVAGLELLELEPRLPAQPFQQIVDDKKWSAKSIDVPAFVVRQTCSCARCKVERGNGAARIEALIGQPLEYKEKDGMAYLRWVCSALATSEARAPMLCEPLNQADVRRLENSGEAWAAYLVRYMSMVEVESDL